jgi:hypothetical protein
MILPPTPRYTLRVAPVRVMMPKLLIIAVFAVVLLAIVAVNDVLFPDQVRTATYAIVWVAALLLLALEATWTFVRYRNFRYDFYDTQILVRGFTTYPIGYPDVSHLHVMKTFFDRFTKTQTLVLQGANQRYLLKHVPDDPTVAEYISRMIGIGKRETTGHERLS